MRRHIYGYTGSNENVQEQSHQSQSPILNVQDKRVERFMQISAITDKALGVVSKCVHFIVVGKENILIYPFQKKDRSINVFVVWSYWCCTIGLLFSLKKQNPYWIDLSLLLV